MLIVCPLGCGQVVPAVTFEALVFLLISAPGGGGAGGRGHFCKELFLSVRIQAVMSWGRRGSRNKVAKAHRGERNKRMEREDREHGSTLLL